MDGKTRGIAKQAIDAVGRTLQSPVLWWTFLYPIQRLFSLGIEAVAAVKTSAAVTEQNLLLIGKGSLVGLLYIGSSIAHVLTFQPAAIKASNVS